MENSYSVNHETTESTNINAITAESVLRRLISLCLLASLVVKKMDYGEELLKRVLEIKVNLDENIFEIIPKELLMLRKNELVHHQEHPHLSNAMQRLEQTLVKAEELLNKVRKSKLFTDVRYGKRIRTFLRDILADSNNVGVALTLAIASFTENQSHHLKNNMNKLIKTTGGQDFEDLIPEDHIDMTTQGDKHFFGIGMPQSHKMALQRYLVPARAGYPPAQNNVGYMLEHGLGVEKSVSEALHWYQLAADQNYAESINNIGRIYELGIGPVQNDQIAAEYYLLAAEMSHLDAMNNLGCCYEKGIGVRQSFEEASRWYRLAADQGHPKAQNNIGTMYYNGKGVEEDPEIAAQWFQKSAEQGCASGLNNLGICYEEGRGTPKDLVMATRCYSEASAKGNENATNNLGFMYLHQKEYEKAASLFRRAADNGSVDALFNIGTLHEKGLGVELDLKVALKYYKQAGEKVLQPQEKPFGGLPLLLPGSSAEAQNNLGIMSEEGIGVDQNFKQAVTWYSLAAQQDHPDALFNLATMYQTGKGVKVNLDKAIQLFSRALEMGHAASQLEITKLDSYLKGLKESPRVPIPMDFDVPSVKFAPTNIDSSHNSGRSKTLKSPLEKTPKRTKDHAS